MTVRLPVYVFPLSPMEEQAITIAVAKRRVEFSAGRHCARLAMAQLGHLPCAIPSGLDRAPVWPSGLVGSITHDTESCAAVVASDHYFQSVGIDMDLVDAVPAELENDVVRPDEIARLNPLLRPDGADWPTLHFCLKEAAYKAFYPIFGKIIGFHEMRLIVNSKIRTFSAEALIANSYARPIFQGRYLVRHGKIHAACWILAENHADRRENISL